MKEQDKTPRSKHNNYQKSSFVLNNQEEPLILSRRVVDTLLSSPNYSTLLGLYIFKYFISKYEKDRATKITTEYVADLLNCTKEELKELKNELEDIGIIQNGVLQIL